MEVQETMLSLHAHAPCIRVGNRLPALTTPLNANGLVFSGKPKYAVVGTLEPIQHTTKSHIIFLDLNRIFQPVDQVGTWSPDQLQLILDFLVLTKCNRSEVIVK